MNHEIYYLGPLLCYIFCMVSTGFFVLNFQINYLKNFKTFYHYLNQINLLPHFILHLVIDIETFISSEGIN